MTAIHEAHDKLYHYTTFDGMVGILDSQSLWATNYRFLNDQSEIIHFKQHLCDMLLEPVTASFNRHDCRKIQSLYKASLEEALVREIGILVGAMYGAAGEGFYIASFCTHSDSYAKENGLLSQWRGYGKDGGYALVLDCKSMSDLLIKENEIFDYVTLSLSDVVYDDDTQMYQEDLRSSVQDITEYTIDTMHSALRGGGAAVATKSYPALVNCMSRYKHRAFREEKEVRLVAYLVELAEKYMHIREQEGIAAKLPKPVKTRMRDNEEIQYIELFKNTEARLPIEQIIVGPHRDKLKRYDSLQQEIESRGLSIKVTMSHTPYI